MFFPVSRSTHVFDVIPTSLLGRSDPLDMLDYQVRPIESSEAHLHPPLADLVTTLINARADLKDLSNTIPLNTRDLHHHHQQQSTDSATTTSNAEEDDNLEQSLRDEVLRHLSSSSSSSSGKHDNNNNSSIPPKKNDGTDEDEISHVLDSSHSTDIHNLAQNTHELLNVDTSIVDYRDVDGTTPSPTSLLLHDSVDFQSIGANDMLGPADTALRGEVVNISEVFDPSNENHLQLFGVNHSDDDDDYDDDDDDDDDDDIGNDRKDGDSGTGQPTDASLLHSAMLRKLHIKLDDRAAQSQLDDELDTLLGESIGVTNISALKKTRARLLRRNKTHANNDDNAWASDDTTDMSDFAQLVPEPAIDYPFNLDTFQKRAVFRLERDENVFVAAHTSAGKTVVAEYAIALAMQRKTKVIYTSPIKTLSNQKFRDFSQRFAALGYGTGSSNTNDSASGGAGGGDTSIDLGNVGIITGDISINPNADCLIMTTEILRSMLYKGADIIRDLSHVIFDECHWINNPERGVVWEEAIIMLPRSVTIVMLSATVPNAMEFAKWVGTTKEKPVYVVTTPKRPVPLSHQIFVKGEMFKIFDSTQSHFLDANYRRAAAHYKQNTKNTSVRHGMGRHHAWMQIIKFLRKRALDPAIFFCFSKRKCDEAAEQLITQDLTLGAAEKSHIHQFYQQATSRLSPADRNVPQITRHREMLKRGIGVHHAGLLPIVKEITEVLFQSGYVRVLFATETFAMGVNMPARTVVFTAIHKFDSQSYRQLVSARLRLAFRLVLISASSPISFA